MGWEGGRAWDLFAVFNFSVCTERQFYEFIFSHAEPCPTLPRPEPAQSFWRVVYGSRPALAKRPFRLCMRTGLRFGQTLAKQRTRGTLSARTDTVVRPAQGAHWRSPVLLRKYTICVLIRGMRRRGVEPWPIVSLNTDDEKTSPDELPTTEILPWSPIGTPTIALLIGPDLSSL